MLIIFNFNKDIRQLDYKKKENFFVQYFRIHKNIKICKYQTILLELSLIHDDKFFILIIFFIIYNDAHLLFIHLYFNVDIIQFSH